MHDPQAFLRRLFDCAVQAADPMAFVGRHVPEPSAGRFVVLGAGKASARMAEAACAVREPDAGLVVTRYGHARPCRGVEIVEAAHPVPDQAGLDATRRILAMAQSLERDDTALALISGGASALLTLPAGRITLKEKQHVFEGLLASGAPIGEINTVRKHISGVKGGRLAAAAHPARVVALMISDVPGDDPGTIGSGPTVGDDSDAKDALEILERRGIHVAASVREALEGPGGVVPTSDSRLEFTRNTVCAAPSLSLAAAADLARAEGAEVRMLGDAIEGEAREVAAEHAALARDSRAAHPVLLLSGGELTVTIAGSGSGGPNAEYALALAIALDGAAGVHAIACDTDGVDGAAEIAGAVAGPGTLDAAKRVGADARAALRDNDAHGFFGRVGGQVVTGPTLTNVNDFRAILVLPR